MRSRLFYVAMAIVMGTIGLVAALALDGVQEMAADLDQTRSDNAKINAELNDQESAASALAEQVKRLGGKPVVEPGEPDEPPTPIPAPVRATQAQVNEAVSVICAGTSSCRPTEAQVKTTLRAICGACRGDDGKDADPAKDGNDGQDATITAEQIDAAVARNCGADGCRGPGPTDEQVDERLAAYCSQRDDCKGESIKGDTGSVTPGDYTCPDGEWITAIHVAEGGTMTVDCAPLIGRD